MHMCQFDGGSSLCECAEDLDLLPDHVSDLKVLPVTFLTLQLAGIALELPLALVALDLLLALHLAEGVRRVHVPAALHQ